MTRLPRITLVPLDPEDRDQFIRDNQWAFKHGALLEFGPRDDHLDENGEIISRQTIEDSLDAPDSEAYRIVLDGRHVGGTILRIDRQTGHNHLDILFVSPDEHSRGIGQAAWQAIEALHPETRVWETCTPYFEKRNIHFYINRCGFHAVEFFCAHHQDTSLPDAPDHDEGPDEMLRFVKVMR